MFQNVFCMRSMGTADWSSCARHPQVLVLAVLHSLGAVGLEVVLAVVVARNPHIVGMDVVNVEALTHRHGLEGVQCIGTVCNEQVLEVLAQLVRGDTGRMLGNPVRRKLLPIGARLGMDSLQGLGRGNCSSGSGTRSGEGIVEGEVVKGVFHDVFWVLGEECSGIRSN